MKLNALPFRKQKSIDDIMAPINAIVAKLKAYREQALADAAEADEEAAAAVERAVELRSEAEEALRLAEKYA